MIVIGTDAHKHTHTSSAVDTQTGRELATRTVGARDAGHEALLSWARELEVERVWAIEDCRHVSGRLERFLLDRGEAVLRVPPKLMAGARKSSRQRGKSDPIDAAAIARAALREGLDTIPAARLDDRALEIRQLGGYRERLVRQRTALINDLRWALHDLDPALEIPARCLSLPSWQDKAQRRLGRLDDCVRVRIARDELRRVRELTRTINELAHELAPLVARYRPELLKLPGCGALTAAKAIGEAAGADRFATPAKFARTCGVAPIPASSGTTSRHRLDRGGNRQLNSALHTIALTQIRHHQPARDYYTRKLAEGKTRRDAIRCLKRHLATTLWRLLQTPQHANPS
jgi:transposase